MKDTQVFGVLLAIFAVPMDNLLLENMVEQYVFKNSSKVWLCYTKAFLAFVVQRRFTAGQNQTNLLTQVYLHFMQEAIKFKQTKTLDAGKLHIFKWVKNTYKSVASHLLSITSVCNIVLLRETSSFPFFLFCCSASGHTTHVWEETRSSTVKRPTGILPDLTENRTFVFASESGCKYVLGTSDKFYYWFKLHPSLGANLTMKSLHTSVEGDRLCEFGGVAIKYEEKVPWWWFFSRVNINNMNSWKFNQILFCGVHPLVSLYPKSNKFSVVIVTNKLTVTVKTKIIVCAVDAKRIYSVKVKWSQRVRFGSKRLQVEQGICLWAPVLCYVKFAIRVEHFKQIRLTFFNTTRDLYEVRDGPGKKSGLLQGSCTQGRCELCSSAFQVMVEMKLNSAQNQEIDFNSFLEKERLQHVDLTKNWIFSLPNTTICKEESFCSLHMASRGNERINVTLTGFVHGGDILTENCSYAGIAFYNEQEENAFVLSHTECVKQYSGLQHSGKCYKDVNNPSSEYFVVHQSTKYSDIFPHISDHKIFVSENKSVLFVFYYYRHYSVLNITVLMSPTSCRGVSIDICKILVPRQFAPVVENMTSAASGFSLLLPWDEPCYVIYLFRSGRCPNENKEDNHLCFRPEYQWKSVSEAGCFLVLNPQAPVLQKKTLTVSGKGVLVGTSLIEVFDDFKPQRHREGNNINRSLSHWKPCFETSNDAVHWKNHESQRCTFSFKHSIESPIPEHSRR